MGLLPESTPFPSQQALVLCCKEAKSTFSASGVKYQCARLVCALSQFPNLTAVRLRNRGVTDTVLEFLGSHCSKLVKLCIGRRSSMMWHETPEESRLLSAAGVARALGSMAGLTSLDYGVEFFPLPDTVSNLQQLQGT